MISSGTKWIGKESTVLCLYGFYLDKNDGHRFPKLHCPAMNDERLQSEPDGGHECYMFDVIEDKEIMYFEIINTKYKMAPSGKHYSGTSTNVNMEPVDLSYLKGYKDGFKEGQGRIFDKYFDFASEAGYVAFQREKFFTKKLWRHVDGFGGESDNIIKNAFVWYWLKRDMDENGYMFPDEIKENINRNQDEKYIPVFEAYETWKENENKKRESFWNKVRIFSEIIF